MQHLTRLARSHRARSGRRLMTCGLLLALAPLARAQRPEASVGGPGPHPIIVNSARSTITADRGSTTLVGALARAANDPQDNVIEFDPAALGAGPVVIRLAESIVVDQAAGGHDRVNGGFVKSGVILDASACPDAGVIVP